MNTSSRVPYLTSHDTRHAMREDALYGKIRPQTRTKLMQRRGSHRSRWAHRVCQAQRCSRWPPARRNRSSNHFICVSRTPVYLRYHKKTCLRSLPKKSAVSIHFSQQAISHKCRQLNKSSFAFLEITQPFCITPPSLLLSSLEKRPLSYSRSHVLHQGKVTKRKDPVHHPPRTSMLPIDP
jgi:hypothetical protein